MLTFAIAAQQKYYKELGLRSRVLNLSLMVAVVLTLLWRQVPGVQDELSLPFDRIYARDDVSRFVPFQCRLQRALGRMTLLNTSQRPKIKI